MKTARECLAALVTTSAVLREYVYKEEQTHPHHVDKVPVPRGRFKAKLIIMGKMTLETLAATESTASPFPG